MILGTGIDIIDVERVAERVGRSAGFRELVFSAGEIAYCESKAFPYQHYAARFAAKEAFLKAIGRGWDTGLQLNEVEIVNDEKGKPEMLLKGETAATIQPLGIRKINVSLSHLKTYATAIVILES